MGEIELGAGCELRRSQRLRQFRGGAWTRVREGSIDDWAWDGPVVRACSWVGFGFVRVLAKSREVSCSKLRRAKAGSREVGFVFGELGFGSVVSWADGFGWIFMSLGGLSSRWSEGQVSWVTVVSVAAVRVSGAGFGGSPKFGC